MERDHSRPIYEEEETSLRIVEEGNNQPRVVYPGNRHRPYFVPGLPAIDMHAATLPTYGPCLLPNTQECPNDAFWRNFAYIYYWTFEYLRSVYEPAYSPPTATYYNPAPLDLSRNVNFPFVRPRPPRPVPRASRQRLARNRPAFAVPENLKSKQDVRPVCPKPAKRSTSTSTSASPTPGTSRQSKRFDKPEPHRKTSTRFMSRWMRHGEDSVRKRSAFKPYARPPKVVITPPSPTFVLEDVEYSPCPLLDEEVPALEVEVEVEAEQSRDNSPIAEISTGWSTEALSNPLLVLSVVCTDELRRLEEKSSDSEET